MTEHFKFPGDYEGVLKEPLKPIVMSLLGCGTGENPLDYETQRLAKIPALFEHFGISDGDLTKLVLALATKYVPGFRFPWPEKKPIDYKHYAKAQHLRIAEAAALTCDYDPEDGYGHLTDVVTKRRDLMQRSFDAGKLPEKPTPRDVLNWCLQNDETFPPPLDAAIKAVERLRDGVKGTGAMTLKERAIEAIEADISAETLTIQQLQTMREVDFNKRYLDRGLGERSNLRDARAELKKKYAPRSS
jgi:hypothetical protein